MCQHEARAVSVAACGLVENVAEVVSEVGRVVLVLRLVVAPPRCLERVVSVERGLLEARSRRRRRGRPRGAEGDVVVEGLTGLDVVEGHRYLGDG